MFAWSQWLLLFLPPLLGVKTHSAGKNEMNNEVVGGVMVSALVCILSVFEQGTLLPQEWTSHQPGVLGEFSPGGDRDGGLSGEICTIFKLGGSPILSPSTAPVRHSWANPATN